MSLEPLNRIKDRAHMLGLSRQFFQTRNVLEVDCGALVKRAPIDSNIDVISAFVTSSQQGFLHTSPEYAMKRLLAIGLGDIFFLGHVYRKGEIGRLHNPEFTMAEWYRLGYSLQDLIQETCAFLSLFLGPLNTSTLSYRDAFKKFVNINYSEDNIHHLIPKEGSNWSRSESLSYILSHHIEPLLGKGELTILTDYPPSDAALSCLIEKNNELVAERFEIYYEGVELANGYHELSNADELTIRFEKENRAREQRGEDPYLLDEEFLSAMKKGLPDCSGVSVGFDRALMLRHKCKYLSEILPFAWK
jgi:elongation factor P--(R)-beta-lysine ligase